MVFNARHGFSVLELVVALASGRDLAAIALPVGAGCSPPTNSTVRCARFQSELTTLRCARRRKQPIATSVSGGIIAVHHSSRHEDIGDQTAAGRNCHYQSGNDFLFAAGHRGANRVRLRNSAGLCNRSS